MSTFKNLPIYAEAVLGWCEVATYDDVPFTVPEVLRACTWNFKGGTLGDYAHAPHLFNHSSGTHFPNGMSRTIASQWPDGPEAVALNAILMRRRRQKTMRKPAINAWVATFAAASAVAVRAQREGTGDGTIRSGLCAVYAVARFMNPALRPHVTKGAWPKTKTYIREMSVAAGGASFLDPSVTDEVCGNVMAALDEIHFGDYLALLDGITGLMHTTRSVGARMRTQQGGSSITDAWKQRAHVAADFADAVVHTICDVRFRVMAGCAVVVLPTTVVALSPSDIGRLYQLVMNWCSGVFSVVAQACTSPGPERRRAAELGRGYNAQVSRVLEWTAAVPVGEEVHVCKAAKRAFGAFLGELAGPLCEKETTALWAEASSGKYASRMDLRSYTAALSGLSAGMAFNLGKVYKLCPAPDASPGTALMERHEMVINANRVNPAIMPEFEAELRAHILRALVRTPGYVPVFRDPQNLPPWAAALQAQKYDRVPSTELHEHLAWEGTGVFPRRSPHNPAVWKDSGLGWDSLEMVDDTRKDRRFGNMLTRMVFDPDCPMPGKDTYTQVHDHKGDLKPESHKDPCRVFYVGNLNDRLIQSEQEVAVESVAKYHPSFMIGATTETREDRVRAVVQRCPDRDMVDIFYSFDVSGWSPRMPAEPQRISHAIWGDVFNSDAFRAQHCINENARVYIHKNGYFGWYTNPSANFEGYNGKEMTMILVALLSLSVRRWRRRIVELGLATVEEATAWTAVLLAYIDDGLAKLRLPRDRAEPLFEVFKEVTVETFAWCGFLIEISKCYPSDRFAIFLNEIYLGGRHVVHGTRAAMTICAENLEAHTTLVERVEAVSAGCRGAVMAGLDAYAATLLQAYHVHRHFRDWTRERDPTILALWSMAPRAFGGLGLPTTLQMGTSGGGAAVEESVRTLQIWARQNATVKRFLLECVRTAMKPRTAASIMAAPLGLSIGAGEMALSRIPEHVREALTRLARNAQLSPLAKEFLAYSSFEAFARFAEAVVPVGTATVVQEQILVDLREVHPHAIFSRFTRRLEMSSTLSAIIGHKALRDIIRDNRRDAAASVALLRTRAGM